MAGLPCTANHLQGTTKQCGSEPAREDGVSGNDDVD